MGAQRSSPVNQQLQKEHPIIRQKNDEIETKIKKLLEEMTIKEKIGQLHQWIYDKTTLTDSFKNSLRNGEVGSILYTAGCEVVNQMQDIVMKESRMKIPIIIGRDIIHGFRTISPIPLAQAASFNPALVANSCRIAGIEGTTSGVRWTFSPMMDIARDPRWGRIAEGYGEDPFLAKQMVKAAVEGYQSSNLSDITAMAACAKHFAGYSAPEGGRDYNICYIPENTFRDIYLEPFKQAAISNCQTYMTGYHSINSIPASANEFLTKQVLRGQWNFDGFVVSDYSSVEELIYHGYAVNPKDAAVKAFKAGVDMEMVTEVYQNNLETLVSEGTIQMSEIDTAVANVLRVKFRLDLFNTYNTDPKRQEILLNPAHLEASKKLAMQSAVLLQNKNNLLPLSKTIKNLAVIGPLADDGLNQLGCWIVDGRGTDTHTPLQSLKSTLPNTTFHVSKGFADCKAKDNSLFKEATTAAEKSDVVLMFMGEDNSMSGENHSRVNINFPGLQHDLIAEISKVGKPIVLLVYAGRSLLLNKLESLVSSILYVWQLGTMSGPAITDLLFGVQSPSGKLPITFPREEGQIPLYYNRKNTGRPNNTHKYEPYTSSYIDIDSTPLYPFGYGLSYSTFAYSNLSLSKKTVAFGETLIASALVKNTGNYVAAETSLLFVRDLVGSYTRPVKELKGFSKNTLKPAESYTVTFILSSDDLRFWTKDNEWKAEPGRFTVWIGPNADSGPSADFELLAKAYDPDEEFEEVPVIHK